MSHPPGSLSGSFSGKSFADRKTPADPANTMETGETWNKTSGVENKRTQAEPENEHEPEHEPKHETGRAPANSIKKTAPQGLEDTTRSKQGLAEGMAERQPPLSDTPLAPLDPLDPTRYGDWEIRGRCIDF